MLRFLMIVVDFLLMEHKIHHDHEDAARARALGGPSEALGGRLTVFPRLFHQFAPESWLSGGRCAGVKIPRG